MYILAKRGPTNIPPAVFTFPETNRPHRDATLAAAVDSMLGFEYGEGYPVRLTFDPVLAHWDVVFGYFNRQAPNFLVTFPASEDMTIVNAHGVPLYVKLTHKTKTVQRGGRPEPAYFALLFSYEYEAPDKVWTASWNSYFEYVDYNDIGHEGTLSADGITLRELGGGGDGAGFRSDDQAKAMRKLAREADADMTGCILAEIWAMFNCEVPADQMPMANMITLHTRFRSLLAHTVRACLEVPIDSQGYEVLLKALDALKGDICTVSSGTDSAVEKLAWQSVGSLLKCLTLERKNIEEGGSGGSQPPPYLNLPATNTAFDEGQEVSGQVSGEESGDEWAPVVVCGTVEKVYMKDAAEPTVDTDLKEV